MSLAFSKVLDSGDGPRRPALTYRHLGNCLGVEAASGFHVCVDIVRFLAAHLAFEGIWFR